jgi:choice-of-anchor A domain-containing protein
MGRRLHHRQQQVGGGIRPELQRAEKQHLLQPERHQQGATLIVNVSGSSALLQGGYQAFDGYNVLFNFADATSLSINTGANVSILAPKASVNGGQGVINGNVVVDSWASQVQINATNFFKPPT